MAHRIALPTKQESVSSESDMLILVDAEDREIGHLDKAACHDGQGKLHRAFSAFVFNKQGELLIQKRASGKRLWPGYWANSCCSHPRQGEAMEVAVRRRIDDELGIRSAQLHDLRYLYKFEYHATFGEVGSEHELCSVYCAELTGEPTINTTEIDDWAWVAPDDLSARIQAGSEHFTPWLRLEWPEVVARRATSA